MKYIYTLFAFLFCSFFPRAVHAQNVYTDIDPDVNDSYSLDVDNNGTIDYSLGKQYAPDGPSSNGGIHYSKIQCDYNYIFSLLNPERMRVYEHGDTIQPEAGTDTIGGEPFHMALFEQFHKDHGSGVISGHQDYVAPQSNKYLGLSFKRNGQWHFGWVKFSKILINNDLDHIVFKSYAYNTQPGQPIVIDDPNFGLPSETDPPLSLAPPETSGIFHLFPNPLPAGQDLNLTLPGDVSRMDIISANGTVLYTYSGATAAGQTIFYQPQLSAGMYFVKIHYADASKNPGVERLIVR